MGERFRLKKGDHVVGIANGSGVCFYVKEKDEKGFEYSPFASLRFGGVDSFARGIPVECFMHDNGKKYWTDKFSNLKEAEGHRAEKGYSGVKRLFINSRSYHYDVPSVFEKLIRLGGSNVKLEDIKLEFGTSFRTLKSAEEMFYPR
ncbi:hypothetical protein J4226_01435 [Candidatus Pacearchaeota archaeon]|nr:hypothetical protein [Candidatus Pacearchaeota archaeon]